MTDALVAFSCGDGSQILVESVDGSQMGGYEQVAVGSEWAAQASVTLQENLQALTTVGEQISNAITEMARRPDVVDVTFGLKLGVSAGVVVSKGSAEANLNVTFTWNRPE